MFKEIIITKYCHYFNNVIYILQTKNIFIIYLFISTVYLQLIYLLLFFIVY